MKQWLYGRKPAKIEGNFEETILDFQVEVFVMYK